METGRKAVVGVSDYAKIFSPLESASMRLGFAT